MSWREGPRDDPGREVEATSNRHVVAFCNDIDRAHLEVDLGADLRVARDEARDEREDVLDAEGRRQTDAERPSGLRSPRSGLLDRGLDGLETPGDRCEKGLAFRGQRELSGRPLEETHAEVSLEDRDVPADRRGGEGEAPGRFGEAAVPGAADEALEVRQGLHASILHGSLKLNQATHH